MNPARGASAQEPLVTTPAIEPIDTTTAGFAGAAERGIVPGYPLPVTRDIDGFALPLDRGPVLVTSFAEFTREFGNPIAPQSGASHGFLGHAVRGFFANGGERAYIARVVHQDTDGASDARRARLQLCQGTVLRLARRVKAADRTVFLRSLRGVSVRRASSSDELQGTVRFYRRADLTTPVATAVVTAYDTLAESITLSEPVGQSLGRDETIAVPGASSWDPSHARGPTFLARTPGLWGSALSIAITNVDGPRIAIAAPAARGDPEIAVVKKTGLARGAFIEIERVPADGRERGGTRSYHEIVAIDGKRLALHPPLGSSVTVDDFVRVMAFDITVKDSSLLPARTESFRGLRWNGRAEPAIRARHYASVINSRSRLVYVIPPWANPDGSDSEGHGTSESDIEHQPVTIDGFPMHPRGDGAGNDGHADITSDDYIGGGDSPETRTGIASLGDVEEVRIIACPGQTDRAVQDALIAQAERLRDRFAVLDSPLQSGSGDGVASVLAHRDGLDSAHAAYYTPWLIDADAGAAPVPPSGHVVGIYARVDRERGVWKAPANEAVRGVTALSSAITTRQQETLNPRGVNVIREFAGNGILVWGARTLSSDPELKYVNVRRHLIHVERSLTRGTSWVAFERNGPETWRRVVDSITGFLLGQWRAGALMGAKPEHAFFVRCNESTMTPEDLLNGRLVCEVGMATVRPAEFVIFRIGQWTKRDPDDEG